MSEPTRADPKLIEALAGLIGQAQGVYDEDDPFVVKLAQRLASAFEQVAWMTTAGGFFPSDYDIPGVPTTDDIPVYRFVGEHTEETNA